MTTVYVPLKIFYYVGKQKSITLAAEELAISQPAVSQAVRHLEEALGSPLFVRTSKGVRLTTEGEVLYSYIKRGYETIRLGEKKFLEMLDLEEGELCIGASDMTLQFYLLEYLERFHEKYPKIRVTVKNAPTPETLKMLQEGAIDFGVISTPIQRRMDFKFRKVRDIQDIFVAGKKFAYLADRKLSYKDLETLPVMCLEGNTSTRAYVEGFLRENSVHLQPEFELADAKRLATELGANMQIIEVDVLQQEAVIQNPPNRCYYCKQAIFGTILAAAAADGYTVILDGTNASDDANDRPGMQALAELRVLSPLRLCGLTKDEIRKKSREAGLFTWDKPAYACLATRIPSGVQITGELLTRVEVAEGALFAMGFTDFRVRVREGGALLQFHRAQMEEARARRAEITEKLKPWFPVLLPDWEVR